MKKIPSLFERDYEGNRQVINTVVPGSEWVLAGEGVPTEKFDGSSCMIYQDRLWKRYDRFDSKRGHIKTAPEGWIPCTDEPDENTRHWPGWVPVSEDDPQDKWHREAWKNMLAHPNLSDDQVTYELLGPKVQGNPYNLVRHELWLHGSLPSIPLHPQIIFNARDFESIREYLERNLIEGIVWHHHDGRMVKIKAKDFGIKWPR